MQRTKRRRGGHAAQGGWPPLTWRDIDKAKKFLDSAPSWRETLGTRTGQKWLYILAAQYYGGGHGEASDYTGRNGWAADFAAEANERYGGRQFWTVTDDDRMILDPEAWAVGSGRYTTPLVTALIHGHPL